MASVVFVVGSVASVGDVVVGTYSCRRRIGCWRRRWSCGGEMPWCCSGVFWGFVMMECVEVCEGLFWFLGVFECFGGFLRVCGVSSSSPLPS